MCENCVAFLCTFDIHKILRTMKKAILMCLFIIPLGLMAQKAGIPTDSKNTSHVEGLERTYHYMEIHEVTPGVKYVVNVNGEEQIFRNLINALNTMGRKGYKFVFSGVEMVDSKEQVVYYVMRETELTAVDKLNNSKSKEKKSISAK